MLCQYYAINWQICRLTHCVFHMTHVFLSAQPFAITAMAICRPHNFMPTRWSLGDIHRRRRHTANGAQVVAAGNINIGSFTAGVKQRCSVGERLN